MKKRIFLYPFILIIVVVLVLLYRTGYFHPKYFILDKNKINAPTGTYLYSVSVDDNNIYDLFSPLFFSSNYKYDLDSNQTIDILFFNPTNGKMLNFTVEKSNLSQFSKYILELKKIEELTLQSKSYDYCTKIYQYNDDNIKSFLFFNKLKHIRFLLSSNSNKILESNIKRLCNKP